MMTPKHETNRLAVHFSSNTDEWSTPQSFFELVNAELGPFDLDPCCLPESAKGAVYYTPTTDGLIQPWFGRVWMNPPYGATIHQWTKKAVRCVKRGEAKIVVALLPARTDTRWWHRDVHAADEIRFIKGRLKFGTATDAAPFPSALVIWESGGDVTPRVTTMLTAELPAAFDFEATA
jgi:phage N-6-adenine-methyltransferase